MYKQILQPVYVIQWGRNILFIGESRIIDQLDSLEELQKILPFQKTKSTAESYCIKTSKFVKSVILSVSTYLLIYFSISICD